MFRNRWTWRAIALLTGLILLVPALGYSVEEDPYVYKWFIGRVYFEYEKGYTEEDDGSRSDHSRFQQTYSLDLKGNILSRRLLIYDTGFSFTDNNYTAGSSKVDSRTLEYYLNTTILPKSAIPLNLYGSRSEGITDTNSESATSKTAYGLNWNLKLRTLPTTSIHAERTQTETSSGDSATEDYRLTMKKALGPTENDFTANYTLSESDSDKTTQNTQHFSNRTDISRSTKFNLGATRSESEQSGEKTSLQGLSMGLSSNPSKAFTQNHSYNYYQSETDSSGKQTGTSYSGNMAYKFSDRLSSTWGLNASDSESESSTSSLESQVLSSSASLSYRVTSHLSVGESVSYSETKSNSSDPTATTGDRKTLRVTTTANYSKNLSWSLLGANYGLGYIEDKAQDLPSGKGVEQSMGLSLGNIDVNQYVGFSTAFSRVDVMTISGEDIHSSTRSYSLSAFNKVWKKYTNLSASFNKYSLNSYISLLENKYETYRFDAVSAYFKNTNASFIYEHTNKFGEQTGFSRSDTESITLGHTSQIWKGALTLSFNHQIYDSKYTGGSDHYTVSIYSANYQKTFLKNMSWQFNASTSRTKSSTSLDETTLFKNTLYYPLRSWLLSAEHKYSITIDDGDEQRENLVLFRATRTFIRVWL